MEITIDILTLSLIIMGTAFFTLVVFSIIAAGRTTANNKENYIQKIKNEKI